ncbi:MAG: glycosyltransferase [Vicinamibacterales bacterium]
MLREPRGPRSARARHAGGVRAPGVGAPHRRAQGSPRFYARVARHLLDPAPYAVASCRSRPYRRLVDRLLASGSFDRVVCDFLVPAINLRADLPCPSILFTHNVEAEIWRRHAETAGNPVKRALYDLQWRRMRRFEARALARFDRVVAVSDADRQTFRELYAGQSQSPCSVVPTGVDTAYFTRPSGAVPRPTHVVFVGSMDWLPNEDAMLWFCRDMLGPIRQAVPGVTLSIVGRADGGRPRAGCRARRRGHGPG